MIDAPGGRYGSKVRYGVFPAGDGWGLYCGLLRLRRYPDRAAAICAGERAAQQAVGPASTLNFTSSTGPSSFA